MDEAEITKCLQNFPEFLGCKASDELPEITEYPSMIVVNTDPRSSAGQHWVALYFPKGPCEKFDSLGDSEQFDDYAEKNSFDGSQITNKNAVQSGSSELCGVYGVSFLMFRASGCGDLFDFMLTFSKNPLFNDLFVYYILEGIK